MLCFRRCPLQCLIGLLGLLTSMLLCLGQTVSAVFCLAIRAISYLCVLCELTDDDDDDDNDDDDIILSFVNNFSKSVMYIKLASYTRHLL